MSNIDIANEFSFGPALTADQVEQIPKFNLARGKIIPIQLNADFDATTWDPGNYSVIPPVPPKATNDSNYNLYITNYPTPFFIIASSQVYNINKVNSMPYNDPRNGKNSDTTTVLQYTVVQGDETNYPQQYSTTEPATLAAGGNGQLERNFYFTPFQGQITQSMVPVYLLPIKTTVKDNINTYLYTFVRADIFITSPSTTPSSNASVVGSGYSYIDYLKNPQNYLNLNQPGNLPNYTNLPDPYPYPYTQTYIYVRNLVFLANNYIGNSGSVNSHASFCRFLTYDDMYNITGQGQNFVQGNTAGPVFFGLQDLPFIQAGKSIPNPPPYPPTLYPTNPPYGNDSIPPYYIFSGRPYSIFFGLHLNTNTFKTSNATYGGTFNNYAKNTGVGISVPINAKGYPVNFLTSLGNNNPTNGAPNTSSNNTSYQKVFDINSTTTQSFYQPNSSNYIGSTYDMDEYYIANSRTNPQYKLSGASTFFNIYKFSLNKYIRFYSGTDGYEPMEIPYDTSKICNYNGGTYNGYYIYDSTVAPTLLDYDIINCNVTQAGLVQNMTLQFVPLNYFVPPDTNVVPSVTDISMAIPINLIPTSPSVTEYINTSLSQNIFTNDSSSPYYRPDLVTYDQLTIQLAGGGGGGGGGVDDDSSITAPNYGGGGGGSGYILGYIGGTAPNGWNYKLTNPPDVISYILPINWLIDVTIGSGGIPGVTDSLSSGNYTDGGDGGSTILRVYDNSIPSSPVLVKTFSVNGGKGGKHGYQLQPPFPIPPATYLPGNGGDGYNGGGGGDYGGNPGFGYGGKGVTVYGGQNGNNGTGSGYNDGGSGGGLEGGPGGSADDINTYSVGGGGAGGSGVITGIQTGGSGTSNGGAPNKGNGISLGLDYTGAGAGGGSYHTTATNGGTGGKGYAILKFSSPVANQFKFPNPENNPVGNVYPYPTSLPTTNSSNLITPEDLFNNISSIYSNPSSIICGNDLNPKSKCGFIPTEYYNSLNRYFYTEQPDLINPNVGPNCSGLNGSLEYDPPVVVDEIGQINGSINIYNSESCGAYTGTVQNLCVPNFAHFSDSNQKPFKCISIPKPDVNREYTYDNYYGMYEEDSGEPVNDNFPNYFKQTPDKKVTLNVPAYIPTPYPKPTNVPGSTKEETFWNSTLFIVLAIILGVAILIAAIVIIVKFSKKSEPYEKARYRYTS
jgi:hypothetical protein